MYVAYRYQHVTSRYITAKTSAFNSLMQQNACYRNIKWTFADLLACYCYAIKTNSRTIRWRLSQPASVSKEGTWVNCKLITAWRCSCEPDSCTVWVSYRQKAVIARIKSINWNYVFSRNNWFLIPISRRGANARFVFRALRTPMWSLTILYQVPQTRPAHLMKRKIVFA